MSVKLQVNMPSLIKVREELRRLPLDIQSKLEAGAWKKALAPMLATAQSKVPILTGGLFRGLKIGTSNKNYMLRGYVECRAPHAYLLEFGHKMYGHVKSGGGGRGGKRGAQSKTTPFVGPKKTSRGFLRYAFDANYARSLRIFTEELKASLRDWGAK